MAVTKEKVDKAAAKVAKEAKAAKATKKATKPAADGDLVTLKQICSELGIEGRVARRKLRQHPEFKDGGRWEWAAGSKDLAKVRKVLAE